MSDVKKEVVNPVTGMTKDEEEEYREAFNMFDINGDGMCYEIPSVSRRSP